VNAKSIWNRTQYNTNEILERVEKRLLVRSFNIELAQLSIIDLTTDIWLLYYTNGNGIYVNKTS